MACQGGPLRATGDTGGDAIARAADHVNNLLLTGEDLSSPAHAATTARPHARVEQQPLGILTLQL